MADAGIVHGQVLQQWPDMFRILNVFLSQREQRAEDEDASAPTTGERLVHVPTPALPDAIPRIDIHFPITVVCTLLQLDCESTVCVCILAGQRLGARGNSFVVHPKSTLGDYLSISFPPYPPERRGTVPASFAGPAPTR
ncbi:hypothetical protein K466DRAFT_372965 [Polyporus arcularius HHB13444]|uniref:Uncharacterized protein n=1 Tax=Polyporus arcularius HHB13444 TaxID=1314778 RepID=A0A5C3NW81_9APHY|nr:hypothetical protein K466DRAFT_372965 [Polyporus arcularius HHB13444]